MHQRQAVDEDRDVIAGVVGAGIDDVLVGDLQAVVVDVLLVDEPDVLGLAVVPDEGLDVVLLDATRLLRDLVPRRLSGCGSTGRRSAPTPHR